jgi:hypothetical protein
MKRFIRQCANHIRLTLLAFFLIGSSADVYVFLHTNQSWRRYDLLHYGPRSSEEGRRRIDAERQEIFDALLLWALWAVTFWIALSVALFIVGSIALGVSAFRCSVWAIAGAFGLLRSLLTVVAAASGIADLGYFPWSLCFYWAVFAVASTLALASWVHRRKFGSWPPLFRGKSRDSVIILSPSAGMHNPRPFNVPVVARPQNQQSAVVFAIITTGAVAGAITSIITFISKLLGKTP